MLLKSKKTIKITSLLFILFILTSCSGTKSPKADLTINENLNRIDLISNNKKEVTLLSNFSARRITKKPNIYINENLFNNEENILIHDNSIYVEAKSFFENFNINTYIEDDGYTSPTLYISNNSLDNLDTFLEKALVLDVNSNISTINSSPISIYSKNKTLKEKNKIYIPIDLLPEIGYYFNYDFNIYANKDENIINIYTDLDNTSLNDDIKFKIELEKTQHILDKTIIGLNETYASDRDFYNSDEAFIEPFTTIINGYNKTSSMIYEDNIPLEKAKEYFKLLKLDENYSKSLNENLDNYKNYLNKIEYKLNDFPSKSIEEDLKEINFLFKETTKSYKLLTNF